MNQVPEPRDRIVGYRLKSRFELANRGGPAVAYPAIEGRGIALRQSEVPFDYSGRGNGSTLVQPFVRAPQNEGHRTARAAVAVSGALVSLVGFVLALGGYFSLEGSAFDLFVGLGLIVSGALVSRRHAAGAWTYMLVLAGTFSWSLLNVAVSSSLAQRMVGPLAAARDRTAGAQQHPISQ